MSHHINSTYWTCLIADSMCTRSAVARDWVNCYCHYGTWKEYKKHCIVDIEIGLELQRLIRHNRISNKTIPPPTPCKLVEMRVLDLTNSNLQDAGVELVSNWIVDSNVNELILETNLITDRGVQVLYEALIKMSREIHVNLNHNLITAVGAALLHQVKHATFTFTGNCISPLLHNENKLPDYMFMKQEVYKLPQVLLSCQMAFEISEEEAPVYIDFVYGPGTFDSFLKYYS